MSMLFAMGDKVNRIQALRRSGRAGLRTLIAGFAILSLLVLLMDCSLNPGRGMKSCRYRFQSLGFMSMDSQASHWKMDVTIANPNRHEVSLTRMRYALLYQADTLLSGWNPEKRVIAAGDSQSISTSLAIPNALWKRLPAGIWSQTDARFHGVADAYLTTWVGEIRVPGAVRETIHIDMTKQVSRYRDMMLKRFFGWPGDRLHEGGIVGPDSAAPRERSIAPEGAGPRPNEHF